VNLLETCSHGVKFSQMTLMIHSFTLTHVVIMAATRVNCWSL